MRFRAAGTAVHCIYHGYIYHISPLTTQSLLIRRSGTKALELNSGITSNTARSCYMCAYKCLYPSAVMASHSFRGCRTRPDETSWYSVRSMQIDTEMQIDADIIQYRVPRRFPTRSGWARGTRPSAAAPVPDCRARECTWTCEQSNPLPAYSPPLPGQALHDTMPDDVKPKPSNININLLLSFKPTASTAG